MAQGHMNPRKHLMGSFQSNYDIVEYICKVLSRGDLDGPWNHKNPFRYSSYQGVAIIFFFWKQDHRKMKSSSSISWNCK